MNKLPVQIKEQILLQLPQRSLFYYSTVCKEWNKVISQPIFYSTLKFYTFQQWEKFIKTVTNEINSQDNNDKNNNNNNDNNNKPKNFYVHHLVIYFTLREFYNCVPDFIKRLPNIQTIYIFDLKKPSPLVYNFVHNWIPPVKQLTHVPFWYKPLFSDVDDKNIIKWLDYKVDQFSFSISSMVTFIYPVDSKRMKKKRHSTTTNSHLQSNEVAARLDVEKNWKHLMGSTYGDIFRDNGEDFWNNNGLKQSIYDQSLILQLPILKNLTRLNLRFGISILSQHMYVYDERTIDAIHQSCPQLEKLALFDFYLNISEKYYDNHYKNNLSDGHHKETTSNAIKSLKEFKLTGTLMDPLCFTYLSTNYPQLTSLDLTLYFSSPFLDLTLPFSLAIYDMITGFPLLKKLFIKTNGFDVKNNKQFFPEVDFLQWLGNHPNQFTHLSYPNALLLNNQQQLQNNSVNDENKDGTTHNILDIPLQYTMDDKFLNYLTYLSLEFDYFVETVTKYLLIHQHTTTVSDSIKEMEIYSNKKNNKNIVYIYDWLTIFPNLNAFSSKGIDYINDDEIDGDNNNTIFLLCKKIMGKEDDLYLHQLMIKSRLQQLQRQNIISDNNNNNNNNNNKNENENENNDKKPIYKLKKLELEEGVFHFKNGFDTFIKRFNKLNNLTLCNIDFSIYDLKLPHVNIPISSLTPLSTKGILPKVNYYEPHLIPQESKQYNPSPRRSCLHVVRPNNYNTDGMTDKSSPSSSSSFSETKLKPSYVGNQLSSPLSLSDILSKLSSCNNTQPQEPGKPRLKRSNSKPLYSPAPIKQVQPPFVCWQPRIQVRDLLPSEFSPPGKLIQYPTPIPTIGKKVNLNMSHLKFNRIVITEFGFLRWGFERGDPRNDRYNNPRSVVEKIILYEDEDHMSEKGVIFLPKDKLKSFYPVPDKDSYTLNLTCKYINMNELPIEIKQHIFQQLSQRNLAHFSTVSKEWRQAIFQPFFYFTTKLYSYQQWIKFIEISRVITIQDKPITHYVYHLYIYFDPNLFFESVSKFVTELPNIQSIHILNWKHIAYTKYYDSISLMNQLTHIPFWLDAPPSNIDNKKRIILMDYKVEHFSLSSTSSSSATYSYLVDSMKEKRYEQVLYHREIAMDLITNWSHLFFNNYNVSILLSYDFFSNNNNNNNNNNEPNNYYQRLILRLPTFENLTYLNLRFGTSVIYQEKYVYDERTIDAIHQSCPRLEKLSLLDFYLSISKEYNYNYNNNTQTGINNSNNQINYEHNHKKTKSNRARLLKEFKLVGTLMDPLCFTYLSTNYPQLISLELTLYSSSPFLDPTLPFSSAIYDMISGFSFLKVLSIIVNNAKDKNTYTLPHHDVFQWLNNHPNQITHLSYPTTLLFINQQQQLQNGYNEDNNHNFQPILNTQPDYITNGCFLNYLIYLSLEFDNFVETATNYLLIHQHTTTVSDSIKEMEIYSNKKNNKNIVYIYDWLTIFPKLNAFASKDIDFIDDGEIFSNKDAFIRNPVYNKDMVKSNEFYLHRLLHQRKQQQQNHFSNRNNTYTLKRLELENSIFYFKHGFNSFIKQFNKLSDLILHSMDFSFFNQSLYKSDFAAFSIPIQKSKEKSSPLSIKTEKLPSPKCDHFSTNYSSTTNKFEYSSSSSTSSLSSSIANNTPTKNNTNRTIENKKVSNTFAPIIPGSRPRPPRLQPLSYLKCQPQSYSQSYSQSCSQSENHIFSTNHALILGNSANPSSSSPHTNNTNATTQNIPNETTEDRIHNKTFAPIPPKKRRPPPPPRLIMNPSLNLQALSFASTLGYSTYHSSDIVEIQLDMSHLILNRLTIIGLGFLDWGLKRYDDSLTYKSNANGQKRFSVDKIKLHDNNINNNKEIVVSPKDLSIHQHPLRPPGTKRESCTIKLACKYVDELIFFLHWVQYS
ncbi:unnamed protein product [Cunninghamella blakesleeana]